MIGALHHIEIYVSSLESSSKFWGWLLERLGYEPYQNWDQGKSWKLADTYIVFVQVQEKHKASGYHRCRIGLNHLAFHAGTLENLESIRSHLQSEGVTLLYENRPQPESGKAEFALFFEDPDRIKVELVASAVQADGK